MSEQPNCFSLPICGQKTLLFACPFYRLDPCAGKQLHKNNLHQLSVFTFWSTLRPLPWRPCKETPISLNIVFFFCAEETDQRCQIYFLGSYSYLCYFFMCTTDVLHPFWQHFTCNTKSIQRRKIFPSVILLVRNGRNSFPWPLLIGIHNTSCIFVFFVSILVSFIKLTSLVSINSFSHCKLVISLLTAS